MHGGGTGIRTWTSESADDILGDPELVAAVGASRELRAKAQSKMMMGNNYAAGHGALKGNTNSAGHANRLLSAVTRKNRRNASGIYYSPGRGGA